MTISLIVAIAGSARVIGKDGSMPWHIPADLARFKRLTMGHPMIMGRKTFESIGKPLRGRTNIVVSKNMSKDADDLVIAHTLPDALAKARISPGNNEVFVIGGERIYAEALAHADRLYLTLIYKEIVGDTFFPPYKHLFQRVISSEATASGGYAITFETLER